MRYFYIIILIIYSGLAMSQDQFDYRTVDTFDTDLEKVIRLSTLMDNYIFTSPPKAATVAFIVDSITKNNDNILMNGLNANVTGMNLFCKKNYEESVRSYLKALDIFEGLDSLNYIAKINNNIASTYAMSGDIDGAASYYKKSLAYYKSQKSTLWIGHTNNNLAILYMNHGRLKEAEAFFKEARACYKKLNLKLYNGIIDLNYGNLKNEQKDYSAAIPLYNNAMTLVSINQNKLLHSASLGGIGTAHNGLGNYSDAITSFSQSIILAKEISHTSQVKVSLEGLAIAQEKLGDFQGSLSTYKELNIVKDTLFKEEQNQSLVDAVAKYEAVEKEKEISELNTKNEIALLKLNTSRNYLIGALAALLIFFGLAYYLYTLNTTIKSQNKVISKALADKDLLLREIHHRVKNNLQFISSLLSLQSEYVVDTEAKIALNTGESRIKSMALIHQNLYREENLTSINASEYFEKLTQNLFDTYNIDPNKVKLTLDVDKTDLDVDTMVPLGLMVNELISNALKYAFPSGNGGKINVSLQENNNNLDLVVADNGIGITNLQKSKFGESFGYKLVDAFLTQLNAKMEITSVHGTTIKIRIKDYNKIA